VHEQYDAPTDALGPDPIAEFGRWLTEARNAGLVEPEAMVLSTAGARSRFVLVRGVDDDGFRFFTNYHSAKAREIAADPGVSLTFGWLALHRSVRVDGAAAKLDAAASDAYFATRPRGSQIGAWASPQSEVVDDLDARVAEITARFEGTDIPRPEFWGGYLVRPRVIEFWQGKPNRLHDRTRYTRGASGDGWEVDRLAP
jgi:pyridoxamine 5'-phosphate oxidase